jgi:hypothetical protein
LLRKLVYNRTVLEWIRPISMFKISYNGTKALAAADVAAPLTECVFKTDVSTPASFKNERIQRATVAVVTAR